MASRIKGITVEINGSTTGLDKALRETTSSINKTQAALKDVNRLLKVDPKNTELLAQKQKLLSQAVEETKGKLDGLKNASEQAAKTVGNYDAWKNAYTPIQEEIGKTQEKVGTLKTKMAELEKAGKVDTAEYKALGDELKNQEGHLESLKQKAKQVSDEFGKPISHEQYDALQREIIETEQNLKNLEQQAKEAASVLGTQMQVSGQKMQEVGDAVSSAGKKIMPVSTAVAGIGVASIKTAADFEAGMSQVAAISGATGGDFEKLRDKAREMGSKTKFSASEAAEAMNYMAMAGWKTEDMLDGVEGIMNLAAASGEDLATTSDIVTDALTAFGLSAKDSAHFADVLAKTSSSSNTNVSMLGETFKYVAPVAGALGYSVEDTSVAIGLMANSGIKASQSGTALRTLLTNMANPTEKMKAAMDDLGVSLDDGNGNMLSFSEVMKKLREGFGGLKISEEDFRSSLSELETSFQSGDMTQKQYNKAMGDLMTKAYGAEGAIKAQTASMLAGKEGMSGLLAIVNASDDDFAKLTKEINNADGAAKEMSEVMLDNLKGDFTILKSKVEEGAISIGEVLQPKIREITKKTGEWTDKFNSLDDKQKKVIVTIGLIVAALGPALVIIGTLISSIGTIVGAIGKLTSLLGGIGGPAEAAGGGVALFSGKLILLIGLIGAVVAIGVLLYKNWDTIKEKAGEIKEKISGKWKEVTQATKDAWNNTTDSIKESWSKISEKTKTSIENAKSTVKTGWENVKNNTSQVWQNIQTTIQSRGGGIKGVINTAVDGCKNVWDKGFSAINTLTGGKLESALSTVKSKMSAVKSTFSSKIKEAKDSVNSGIDKIKGIFKGLKLKLPSIKIPKIKLPKFSISGKFSLAPPTVPKIGVKWNKDGAILSGAQIFGRVGNTLLGGGEKGKEAVLPLDSFYDRLEAMLKKALNINIPDLNGMMAAEYGPNINVYVGNEKFDAHIVKTVERKVGRKQQGNRKARGL